MTTDPTGAAVDYALAVTGLRLSAAGRVTLEALIDHVVVTVIAIRRYHSVSADPWTALRTRTHASYHLTRSEAFADVPRSTRTMVVGTAPGGADSLIQVAVGRPARVPSALRARWLAGIADLDPAANPAAVERLARRRASRLPHPATGELTGPAVTFLGSQW